MCDVLVKSKYGNIRGVYEEKSSKTWHCARNGSYLYKQKRCWVIGKSVQQATFLASSTTDGEKPWSPPWDETVTEVTKLDPVDTSKCPDAIVIIAKYGNIEGGYRRMPEDKYGYPQYENVEHDVILWHDRSRGEWQISKRDPSEGHFFVVESSEVDPTSIPAAAWGDKFQSISVVTWDTASPSSATFVDSEFPAQQESVGSVRVNWDNVEWIRAGDLIRGEKMVLFDNISPTDLLQGEVGDCWLIASLAALAEFPQAVESLFVNTSTHAEGRYNVRLYDVRTEEWVTITVDDYIPCVKRPWYQQRAEPLFAKAVGNELWPVILEKAFAKFVGAWGELRGGATGWAWQCLTGCAKQVMVSRKPDGWAFFAVNLEVQKEEMAQGDRRSLPFFRKASEQKSDPDSLFYYLVKGDLRGYLMSSGIRGETEKERTDGLVENHAYSIIQVVDMDGQRLLQLRNPWGNATEWNGPWSDNSDLWEQHSAIRTALNHVSAPDGAFWMHFDDWTSIFTHVNVCPCEHAPILKVPRRQPRPADFLVERMQSGLESHEALRTLRGEELEVAKKVKSRMSCWSKKSKKEVPSVEAPRVDLEQFGDGDAKIVMTHIQKLRDSGATHEVIVEKLTAKGVDKALVTEQLAKLG